MEHSSVLIIEDELITAEAIAQLLREEEYEVAGIAGDATSAIHICNTAAKLPSVIICDIRIKGEMNGIELAAELKKKYQCEIIFLTAFADTKTLNAAFKTEPVMYVVKPYADKQLLVAVQMAFHKIFNREKVRSSTSLVLTDREKEIAGLVAQGFSSKQVSSKLNISIETVKTHRRRMLQKNNISSFPHLVYLLNNRNQI